MKVGLIVGGGELPRAVIEGCRAAGHELSVIALSGANVSLPNELRDGLRVGLGYTEHDMAKLGAITKTLRKEKCTHVCFAGTVARPDFSKLKPDWTGLKRLPQIIAAAKRGDDALLSHLLSSFESDGFEIIAPQELCAHILMPEGYLGALSMSQDDRVDCEKACRVARQIGALDIGQAAVVCGGLVLAVEAQEGTDAMLDRISELPEAVRGTADKRRGVLAKMLKPGQEKRVDLPTIGLRTVELAAKAGLAGIVTEGGQSFVLSRAEVIKAADAAGIFIAGLPSATS